MKIASQAIRNPIAVIVVAAMVMLLGAISIFRLPAQLLPDIEKPIMSVMYLWPGASPTEVESEIGVPIEEVLQGTPGMTEMMAWNMSNLGWMQIEFALETDMTRAMVEVTSRLNRMRALPSNAEKPMVMMGQWGDSNETLIEYYIQSTNDDPDIMQDNIEYIRDVVVPELQALYGVSNIDFNDGTMGGAGNQFKIVFDPYKAADYGIDIARIPQRLRGSADVSSGFVDLGRKQYSLRFEGRYEAEEIGDMIIEWREGKPVRLRDIGEIRIEPGRRDGFIYQNGNPAFRLSITKTNGTNVLDALKGIKLAMHEFNDGPFKERGLVAAYSFDPSTYINRAIRLLGGNLIFGVMLAIGVLWAFLRQWRATFIIALAIPVSLLATFVVLSFADRTLNVISLAGLAFATGMVLDAAIVVLENIVRLRERGEDATEASDKGVSQVWGALLASTATTVAIFIPVMFLEDVEGQMFADLALTIAIGVIMSLVVAITILPMAARYWLRELPPQPKGLTVWDRLTDKLMGLTNTRAKRWSWVLLLIAFSLTTMVTLWPKSNYLPPMKADTIDSFMSFPPGGSVETADKEIAALINERLKPHLAREKRPYVESYFLWSFPGATGGWLSVNGVDDSEFDINTLTNFVQMEILTGIPDAYGFAFARELFGGFETPNSVGLQITSKDLDAAQMAAMNAMGVIMQNIPGAIPNPSPDPAVETSELRFTPNDRRLSEVGWTRADLTTVIMELGQGAWLGEYFDGRDRLDIFLKSETLSTPEEMASLPVHTPLAGVVPLGELANIEATIAPGAIVRFDRKRGYVIEVAAPAGMSLEELVDALKEHVEPVVLSMLPVDGAVKYGGNAEDLERAKSEMLGNFLLAILLLVLIMTALFRSFWDACMVLISIPMAGVGGVLLIKLMGINLAWEGLLPSFSYQAVALDLLGYIGFIILLGLVVNNAILLVAQTRIAESRGMHGPDAVRQALRLRLRPIFMSTLTSLFGMLPLLVIAGAGSDIYKGMAAAIVGGMSVSTIFTLILLPSLLLLFHKNTNEIGGLARSTPIRRKDQ